MRIIKFFNNKLMVFVLIQLIVFTSLRQLLFSEFGVIDDHEIIRWLGPDKKLTLSDIFNEYGKTEISSWPIGSRFRPFYYLFRLIETFLWRDNVALWYGTRIFILGFVLFIFYNISLVLGKLIFITIPLRKSYNLFLILCIALGLTLSFWVELVPRLGPAETYFVVPFAIMLLSVVVRVERPLRKFEIILFYLSLFILPGIKENGIPISIVFFILFNYLNQTTVRQNKLVYYLISFTYILFIASMSIPIINLFMNVGEDIYGQSVESNSLLQGVYFYLQSKVFWFYVLILFVTCTDAFFHRKNVARMKINLIIAALNLVLLSDFIFYRGNFMTDRYLTVILIIGFIFTIYLATRAGAYFYARISKKSHLFIIIQMIILIMLNRYIIKLEERFQILSGTAQHTRKGTTDFNNKLTEIEKISKGNRSLVILYPNSIYGDYEPSLSIPVYLDNFKVPVDNIISTDFLQTPTNDFESRLSKSMFQSRENKLLDNSSIYNNNYKICIFFDESVKAPIFCNSIFYF
jgi:hypothetical protein